MTSDKVELEGWPYEGRLTLEKWTVWAKDAVWSSESYSEVPPAQSFEVIAESEFVLDTFFSFPATVQNSICTYLQYGEDQFRDFTSTLELRYRIKAMDQSIFTFPAQVGFHNWATSPLRDSSEIVKDCLSRRGEIYRAEFEGFRDHQSLQADHYSANLTYMTDFAVHALGLIYGCKIVREVISEWIKMPGYHNLVELVAVVDNWQTLKDYSIDWAVHLAGGSHG